MYFDINWCEVQIRVMAKQIKVIKCPQCGGNKPVMIDKDHYRCSKCDTEFILDSDDINVNVNHNYGQYQTGKSSSKSPLAFIIIFIVAILFALSIGIGFITKQFNKTSTRTVTTASSERKDIVLSVLTSVNGQAVAFYLEDENTLLSDNGYSAVFYDVVSGKKIRQQNGLFKDESISEIECRKFVSDNSCYIVINNSHIYKVGVDTLLNMYDEISSRKPALNSGYSKAWFTVDGYGEGFALETKLGKSFYYFPASDALYTEKAMNHVMKGKFETLTTGATDMVYYIFRNKESKQSSNVSELMEITYKFNNGGPECKLLNFAHAEQNGFDTYRIVSHRSITQEFICFSPQVLYYDKEYILITYKSTLADDAVRNVQLLDTKGTVLWTVPVEYNIESEYSLKSESKTIVQKLYNVRTGRGFMLQNEKNSLLEISLDGKNIKSYKLPK